MPPDIRSPESLTKQYLTSQDILYDIDSVEDDLDRQMVLSNVRMKAGELRVKEVFDDNWKAYGKIKKKELAEQNAEIAEKKAAEESAHTYTFKDASDIETTYNTGHWICSDKDGVQEVGAKGEKTVASQYPVVICRKLTNKDTGYEKVTIAWRKDGRARSCPVPREMLASNTKLVNLAKLGVPVTSETSKAMVRYLDDFEKGNPQIPREVSTSKFGWAGADYGNEFIPYTGKIIYDGETTYAALVEAVMNNAGTYDEWLTVTKQIRAEKRKEPMICLAASFGSIIPTLIDSLPFIVNLYGETGRGKTVCLMLAASIWANPSGRGYIAESNSTLNAMESKLSVLNNLPLMIDDLSKIRNRQRDDGRFADIVYTLCAGGGKARMNKDLSMRETSSWCNIILSNMERPLTDSDMQGGAMNRVIDFEMQEGDVFEDGNAIVKVISKNYGWAGRAFVQIVRDHMDEIPKLVEDFQQKIISRAQAAGEEKTQKQVMPLAILLTADFLSGKYLFQDDYRLDLAYCVSMLKNTEDISEMERAYEHFKDEVISHPAMFDSAAYRSDTDTPREFWGKWQDDYICIIPSRLEDIARKCNFSAKQFVAWLDGKGLLQKENGRMKKLVRFGGDVRYRCYVINVGILDEGNAPANTDDSMDDLPFN